MNVGTARYKPPPSRLRRPLILLLVVVLITVGIVAFLWVRDRMGRCDGQEDVRKAEDTSECIGVTAAGSDFDQAELRGVVDRIREENTTARAGGEYVSVAVFLPMTIAPNGITTHNWVRGQLQGAYQAQVTFNRSARPKVQLLLANPGNDMRHWRPVVEDLASRRGSADRLVAVTGIGLSLDHAHDAMLEMSRLRIPMVGSTITADDLRDIPGLLRPAPTNERQAQAAANYLKGTGARTALLVRDTNSDDSYPTTLATAFTAQFNDGHRVLEQAQQYDSGLSSVDNAFALMKPNICATEADVVFFAGRGRDLVRFVEQLATRLCGDRVIRIVTGDDISVEQLDSESFRRALAAGVEVTYTEVADKGAWEADQSKPEGQRAFHDAAIQRFVGDPVDPETCFECLFGEEALSDDGAIMSYDAMLTVTTAIQRASGVPGKPVTTAEVLQTFNSLNGQNAVPGVSGLLSYDNDGTAHQKVVPLMRLDGQGKPTFVQLVSD